MVLSAAAITALEKAVKEREAIKITMTWLEKRYNDHSTNPITESKVTDYLKTIDISQDKIQDTFQRISAIIDAADIDVHADEYTALLDRVIDLRDNMKKIQKALAGPSIPVIPTSGSTRTTTDIRLPRLNLPFFSGKIEEWTPFRDMFTTAIDKNPQLSNSEKLTYLKAQLTGEAARQVQAITITDTNYPIAWTQLTDRYQNERMLIFAILKRFTQQQQITSVSPSVLRQLIDISRECMRSLEVLLQPVKEWDAMLLFQIYQKLDLQSKEHYEQTLKDNTMPKLDGLFNFLEQRSRALEAGGSKPSYVRPATQSQYGQRAVAHHTQSTNSTNCKVCNQSTHPIYQCQVFLNLSIPARIEALKKARLCFNCLRDNHSVQQCSSTKTCRNCNAKHHSLIHRPQLNLFQLLLQISINPKKLY
jgi:hypothetical protein